MSKIMSNREYKIMNMTNYDQWKLDTPPENTDGECDWCSNNVNNETALVSNCSIVCEECYAKNKDAEIV